MPRDCVNIMANNKKKLQVGGYLCRFQASLKRRVNFLLSKEVCIYRIFLILKSGLGEIRSILYVPNLLK